MKAHTSEFKEKIKEFGRELDSKITYGTTELGKEELNSVTPHYESTILKSVMKQLDVDSNVEIPLETVINYQFGVKVGNGYEYLDYGNYVVYKVEKQEDTRSWKITCYDKMLYAMKPYENLGVSYPITIKNYLQAICTKLGLALASGNFANEDKQIMNELYLDASGNGLDYTFRDVLDEIAQATGSTICINENDELEVRYPQNVGEYETAEGTDLTLENVDDGKDIDYELNGNTIQDGTPTPEAPIEVQTVTGRQKINIYKKNLLDLKDGTYSQNGITAVVSDGEISLNGTASANAFVYISTNNKIIFNENTSYTISAFNSISNSNVRIRINSGGQLDTILNSINKTQTINTNSYTDIFSSAITIRVQNGTTLSNFKLKPMIEKGTTASEYEVYKRQSYEINLGKNLFDNTTSTFSNPSRVNITTTIDTITITTVGETTSNNLFFRTKIPDYYLENGKTYTLLSENVSGVSSSLKLQLRNKDGSNANKSMGNSIVYDSNYSLFIVGNIFSGHASDVIPSGTTAIIKNVQVEKGTQSTSFSPYKTPIELCKIGNYKDRIYKENGKWYLKKEIGKVVLNGTENWQTFSYGTNSWRLQNLIYPLVNDSAIAIMTTKFKGASKNDRNTDNSIIYVDGSNVFTIRNTPYTTQAQAQSGMSGEPVYYILATPTTTEITDTELINQLKAVELLEGMNNIFITSSNLSSPLQLTYLSEMDTIDEEYLKDVNVNFGEKFGPVNSVVLSRAAESDSIYQKDDESIEQNGLTEIKIKDNQILNGNNRDEFLPSIFEKLNGLEYYLTDFSSTGVTYYDLLDKYKINVFDNSYKTIMLNNEVDITQGLEEQIYADRLEESETDYTKSDKTDRKINQAYIIVDKQNQQINSVVQSINTLQSVVNNQGEQVDALGTRLTQTIDNITASVTSIQTELDNGVSLVKTTSVIIDDSGLNVSTDNSKISTTMTNNSFEIKDSGDNMLAFFGYDETENISKSQMDNLTVTNYFVSGYHRTEKFERNGEKRTGHFYIG